MGKKITASIDIGSNTVLLLVGAVEGRKVQVLYEDQFAPRLGRGVDIQKNLSTDAMNRVIDVLGQYKKKILSYRLTPADVRVVATSAVRDANNRQLFVDRIKEKTGFITEILSGVQEAALTFLGAQSVLDENSSGTIAVIDIGGGSTEVAIAKNTDLIDRYSFDMGSVRFTERYLPNGVPAQSDLENCRNSIRQTISNRLFTLPENVQVIGVSGTVTSIVAIELGLQTYQSDQLNGYKLSVDRITSHIAGFSEITGDQLLEKYPTILKGRADVFLAGLLILEGFMQWYNIPEIVSSTGGIRHGALFDT